MCCVAQHRLAVASLLVVIAMAKASGGETPRGKLFNTHVMCVQKTEHKAKVMCVAGHPTRVQDIFEGAKV